jgi:FkbM family methyltransferase
MTAIDVGADTGYYTLLFAKRVGRLGRVVAFEPIPSARKVLEDNLRLNNYTNVTVCDFALFSSNGSVALEAPRDLSRIAPTKTCSDESAIEIQTRVFDEYASELETQRIDLVKIDVEGAELDVLLGMRGSIEKYHPALLIEIHPQHINHFDHTVEDLLGFLETMKYSLTPVDKPSLDFGNDNITVYCT